MKGFLNQRRYLYIGKRRVVVVAVRKYLYPVLKCPVENLEDERRDEPRHASSRARRRQRQISFCAADWEATSLGSAEVALKPHARNSDSDTAIKLSGPVLSVDASMFV